MPKVVKCPALRCGSTDISPVGVSKKAGLGKGIIGAAAGALVNPVGAVVGGAAGLMSGKKEATFRCNKCGKIFTVKI